MTDPTVTPPDETVTKSNVVVNPIMAAGAVLLAALSGYLAHGGRPTQADLATLIPAALAFALAVWRGWVAHHNADKANRIASNPANQAVSLK